MVKLKDLPKKFQGLWARCIPLLIQARPGDLEHTRAMVKNILEARGQVKCDWGILLPVAMLHDVAHIVVFEKHFKEVAIQERLRNSKLIEVSPAGKIAKNLLERTDIEPEKIEEILKIINLKEHGHTEDIDSEKVYDTPHKKLFHDFDLLTRFSKPVLKRLKKTCVDKEQFRQMVAGYFKQFFFDELRELAQRKFRKIEGVRERFSWSEH